MEYAIGIDLGTTYSVCAVYREENTEIIHSETGSHTTASWVAFTDQERVVGDTAKDRASSNAHNTVYGVKRLIGRSYDDKNLEVHMSMCPYKIRNNDNKPIIEVTYKGETKQFAPQEISAMVLEKLKIQAETFLKEKVTKAVITVPAHFNDAQRQATKEAGRIAGLQVLRIINEPTAAALAYGLHNKYRQMKGRHTILVYDFGGGTFDVSIITIEQGVFDVQATNGEAYLGGDDIDINLTKHFIQQFKQRHGIDITNNQKAVKKLRQQCENLKKALSFMEATSADFEYSADIIFELKLDKHRFYQINAKLFDKTIQCVKKTLEEAQMTKEQIDEVVLIGGSTRIPKVREIVKKFFDGKELHAGLNPDEAVAKGAAIQAGILSGRKSKTLDDILLHDVNPLSLGIATVGGNMNVIIPRNTKIPANMTEAYETSKHMQTKLLITVYEGERPLVCNNRKLGEFTIYGIHPKPRGEVLFDVNFTIDSDGILSVTAEETSGQFKKELSIATCKGYLPEEEIQRMIQDAQKFRDEDEKRTRIIKVKLDILNQLDDLKNLFDDLDLSDKKVDEFNEIYYKTIDWLDRDYIKEEDCINHFRQVKHDIDKILEQHN